MRRLFLGLFLITAPAAAQPIRFEDRSATAGIETDAGYGVAVADFDRDGWDDLFLAAPKWASKLYRNNGDGTFTDVSATAGVEVEGNYVVALWADVDNDGWLDLFLGNRDPGQGQNRLFRNDGDGTFTDVSVTSGLHLAAAMGSATFGDVDGDGRVDLFLATRDKTPDLLYRNVSTAQGIRFEDVTAAAGVAGKTGSIAMQATFFDYDHDGRLDLFAVHDGNEDQNANRLYRNPGTFPLPDVAAQARIATASAGKGCCPMGIAWGDVDGDGWEDAYVTRIATPSLFMNHGDGTFTDVGKTSGASLNGMAWGTVLADLDLDGDLDLFVADTYSYNHVPSQLFRNDGAGTFTGITTAAGVRFDIDAVGAATGDFNRDGRPDLVLVASDGRHRLLINETQTTNHYLAVRLEGKAANHAAIGVRVVVEAGGKTYSRTVSGGDSYCSQSSPVLHFGLGDATHVDAVRVYWGGDAVQVLTSLAVDQEISIQQSAPTPLEAPAPAAFLLESVTPNPASGPATVAFSLAEATSVHLRLYDVLGREVAALADGDMTPGRHTVVLETASLPPGLYLLRLVAGAEAWTQRLIVRR